MSDKPKRTTREFIGLDACHGFITCGVAGLTCDQLDTLRARIDERDKAIAKLSESVELLTATVKMLRDDRGKHHLLADHPAYTRA